MKRLAVLAVILLLTSTGCLDPLAPQGAQRVQPQAGYRQWYVEIEQCAGITGQFASIEWWVVPGDTALVVNGQDKVVGYWRADHEIVLASGYVESEATVKHEMLHDLLQSGDHPAVFDRCGVR